VAQPGAVSVRWAPRRRSDSLVDGLPLLVVGHRERIAQAADVTVEERHLGSPLPLALPLRPGTRCGGFR
jgi:hypothetical protein